MITERMDHYNDVGRNVDCIVVVRTHIEDEKREMVERAMWSVHVRWVDFAIVAAGFLVFLWH